MLKFVAISILFLMTSVGSTFAYGSHQEALAEGADIKALTERAMWREKLKWPDACEEDWHSIPSNATGISVSKLAEETQLITVQCFLAAYQSAYRFYIYNSAKNIARPVALPEYHKDEKDQLSVVAREEIGGFAYFNEKDETLQVSAKFRGLGDCGSLAVYKFDGDGNPKIKSYKAQFECKTGAAIDPDDYPQIYPAK